MKLFEIYENTGQWITHRQLAKIIYMRTGNAQLARDFDAIEDEFVSQDDMQSTGLSGFNVDPFEFDRDRVNKILGDHNTGVKVLKMKQDDSYNTLYQIMQMARLNAGVIEAGVIDFAKATDPANTPMGKVNKLLQRIGISDYGVIINKPFDSKIYELLIDTYMNKVFSSPMENKILDYVIKIYQKRGEQAKQLPPTTEGTRCWKGYKKKGMKTMFGKRVPNCVKNESEDWDEGNWEYFMQQLKASGWPQNRPSADVDGKLVDLLNDPKAGKEHKEQIRKYFNFMGGFDIAIPGDVIDQEQLGKVKVLKITDKDIYNMPAEYLVKTKQGSTVSITFDELVLGNEYGSETDIGSINEVTDADAELIIKQIINSHGPKYLEQEFRKFFPMLSDQEVERFLKKYRRQQLRLVKNEDVSQHFKSAIARSIDENFADGKKKGKSRPGRVKRAGASCKGSVSSLRAKAKKYSGERGKMYHWCANMKGGKKKK